MPTIRCTRCGDPYPENGIPFRCPQCGGVYDFDGPPDFDVNRIEPGLPGYWRYRYSFSLAEYAPIISLGEGRTPLIWVEERGQRVGLKMEHLNPTGSYKDRGSSVLMSQLAARGATRAVEDSSGNAGASFAAYAARAGVRARVYVPESASGPKRTQIEKYGADLVAVPGPRSAATEAVLQEAEKGIPYGSHAYLPFGLPGIATIAYELWEELGDAPGTIIAPVGHGGLLLGIVRGFAALRRAGLIKQEPFYSAVQASNCAPMVAAAKNGMQAIQDLQEAPTIAEGVRVRWPIRVETLLNEMDPSRRIILGIGEEKLIQAFHDLPRHGVHVEPTSALAWAAFQKNLGVFPEPVVIILTGSGLKSTLS